jgi:omega-6 fatty acid desaturase (delta-12 desaturase)
MAGEPSAAAAAARAWRASLPRDRRLRSTGRGVLVFAVSAAAYALTFLGVLLLPWPWARVACLAACPLAIGGLFVVGHDACHHALTPFGWLNCLLGRLSFLPAWHPYTSWVHAHNRHHHGGTNLKGRESAFVPFTKAEFDALPAWRRWLERFYRTPPGVGVFYAVDFWVVRLLLPPRKYRSPDRVGLALDRLLVAVFFVLQLGLAARLARANPLLIVPPGVLATGAVLLPFALWIWFMGFVSFIQHTHPRLAWYDEPAKWAFYHVQLRSTAHVVFPWPVERLLNNIMDHAAHHIDPTLPLYVLPQSQRELEEQAPGHAVVIRWTPAEYFRTCRACKLYDFERDCWTDFDGVPTTPLGLSGLNRREQQTTKHTNRHKQAG